MNSGVIPFSRLFDYIKKHRDVPRKTESEFEEFKKLYLSLVKDVGDVPGWYAWVRMGEGHPKVIYIGQSQVRKTASLRARLKEEFLDEFIALWATIWDPEEVIEVLNKKYDGKYASNIRRSARKAGSTHIVWFGREGLSDAELDGVEHDLIQKMNPPANRQHRQKPHPFSGLTVEAESVLSALMSGL
jgi:hypothetical protein